MVTWTVRTYEEFAYRIHETDDCLSPENHVLARAAQLCSGRRRLLVVDHQIDKLYGDRLRAYFAYHGAVPETLVISAGEHNKSLDALRRVLDGVDDLGLNRRSDPIVVVGGGVVTDVVGLAASLYRRGTPFIRVPTTLVGIIDAGVGVKTGINYAGGKNRLGTYYPSADTILDRTFLRTLSERHIRNGIAEAIKVAIMRNRTLFGLLETHVADLVSTRFDCAVSAAVIDHAVSDMLGELEPNLREHELRRLVDFGHTFSPQLEMVADGELLHGEAVAIDMAISTAIAARRAMITEDDADRILSLLLRAGLPLWHRACTPAAMRRALDDTTRHRDGRQHCPLPTGLGAGTFVEHLTHDEIEYATEWLKDLTLGVRVG